VGRDLEPLADRCVVRVVKDAEVTAGGVVLPDSARERSQRGIVLAVGPGRIDAGVRVGLDLDVGDVVLFSKYGGTELPEGLDTLLVLREADVLCKERQVDGPGMTGDAALEALKGVGQHVTVGQDADVADLRSADRVAEEARAGYRPVLTPENARKTRELELSDALVAAFEGVEGHVDVSVDREGDAESAHVVVTDGVHRIGGAVLLDEEFNAADVARATRMAWERRDELPGSPRSAAVETTPEGMQPMPDTDVATQYELITYEEAVGRGLLEAGRTQGSRNGYRYDTGSYCYWPEPDAAVEAGDR
jgi:chaperonin GroES